MKNQPTKVQKLIYSMLTENTGGHFLDSGDAYGRHWERNQKKSINDFMNEDAVIYYIDTESKHPYIERTVSVFHYLSNLELDEICDKFNKANSDTKDWDGELYGVSAKGEGVLKNYGIEVDRQWNTYNGDSDLSQTLQGANLKIFVDGQFEDYILVQVHNGCDVRGGYTDAKLFKMNDDFYNIWEYMSHDEIVDNELEYIEVKDHDGNVLTEEQVRNLFELV